MLSSKGTVSPPMITTLPIFDHITRSGLMSVNAISMGKTNLWLMSNKTSQSFDRDRIPLTGLVGGTGLVAPSLTKEIPVGVVLLGKGRACYITFCMVAQCQRYTILMLSHEHLKFFLP